MVFENKRLRTLRNSQMRQWGPYVVPGLVYKISAIKESHNILTKNRNDDKVCTFVASRESTGPHFIEVWKQAG